MPNFPEEPMETKPPMTPQLEDSKLPTSGLPPLMVPQQRMAYDCPEPPGTPPPTPDPKPTPAELVQQQQVIEGLIEPAPAPEPETRPEPEPEPPPNTFGTQGLTALGEKKRICGKAPLGAKTDSESGPPPAGIPAEGVFARPVKTRPSGLGNERPAHDPRLPHQRDLAHMVTEVRRLAGIDQTRLIRQALTNLGILPWSKVPAEHRKALAANMTGAFANADSLERDIEFFLGLMPSTDLRRLTRYLELLYGMQAFLSMTDETP